jgi:pimeloyl-ACP methyl ester carboxylesterase
MLATCEKRPLSAKPNMFYCRPLAFALAILCFLPISTLGQTATTVQNSHAPIGKLVDVGGYRVHLYCTGVGSPPVVIVGAGFSFNWELVQPEVAKFAQVCSYDHSGIGWSDSGPADSCSLRVNEVQTALKNLGLKGPYVLVGHSLGGLVTRLYAGKYPEETEGIVFVDHAFTPPRFYFVGSGSGLGREDASSGGAGVRASSGSASSPAREAGCVDGN